MFHNLELVLYPNNHHLNVLIGLFVCVILGAAEAPDRVLRGIPVSGEEPEKEWFEDPDESKSNKLLNLCQNMET